MSDHTTTDIPIKLVVPTNFSKKSEMALEFALMYSTFNHAEVYLFHVLDKTSGDFRAADRENEDMMDRMKETVMTSIEKVAKQGVSHAVDRVHRRIAHGKPWVGILRIAAGINADMIIMGAPSASGFKHLIDKAPCSLVLLKEKDPTFVVQ